MHIIFDLNNYLETNLDSSVKRYIRKAEKNRIFIEPYSDISRYYDLYCDTYTRKNQKPPAPKSLFTGLYSFIQDNNCGEMIAAKTPEGEIAVCGDYCLGYPTGLQLDGSF